MIAALTLLLEILQVLGILLLIAGLWLLVDRAEGPHRPHYGRMVEPGGIHHPSCPARDGVAGDDEGRVLCTCPRAAR